MKYYIGIDLGTTNSAICSYDGQKVRVWKSPEQNDVTPSAIYINKRGNRFYGKKAYDLAPLYPDNSAVLFKRFMGTSTRFELKAANLSLTPEECSSEILKVLYGYLPEEIRSSGEIATVITVPAAFNQMKKDATLQAARMAGLGRVALMQEPVAAVMSVINQTKQEGIFLVYDLGGGTFDVSIASNIGGRINLLAHGGKEMCGGRDFDRRIFHQIVVPWLMENYSLPEDFLAKPQYKKLYRLALWDAEHAKIDLTPNDKSTITLDEMQTGSLDIDGNEIYIDVPLNREQLDSIISDIIDETIELCRETLKKTGYTSNDFEKIVFVGGPTNYRPLRDKVTFELAIPANIDVNHDVNRMTAVAEGACIFAESIDWSSERHYRKAANAELKTQFDISFKYTARTSDPLAKLAVLTDGMGEGYMVEVTSIDTGTSSGRAPLKNGMILELSLPVEGENTFKVVVYDNNGQPLKIQNNRIVVTKTMATIDAIPASHSIFVEVLDKLGGISIPDFLVKEGEALPKKGHKVLKAGQTLKAGSPSSLNIRLWEGTIENPIKDNLFIGVLHISGMDFEEGVIPTGADIECDYEISDSGNIILEVSIPCIHAAFEGNFYFRNEIDLEDTDKITEDSQKMLDRIDSIAGKIDDDNLLKAREKAQKAASLADKLIEIEDVQQVLNELQESKILLAKIRKENIKEISQMDLDGLVAFFNEFVRQYAKPFEEDAFDKLVSSAQKSIDRMDDAFDNQLDELRSKNFYILWRQDWFVIDRFNEMIQRPYNFSDKAKFEELKIKGQLFLQKDQIEELRAIMYELFIIQIKDNTGENMLDPTNIIKR
ncbi:MAG: Hsp70 family protein [Desulfotomaculaceae bacterium]|nr:Hsp70 family protein [Desulfotomaculaceae bacterium]